jgi:endonuclease/exonuclease/phosphatase family metal-dependent hydrolase
VVLASSCSDETDSRSPSESGRNNASGSDEIVVMTVNAHQYVQDEARLRTLAEALGDAPTDRPPDVVLLQEIEADGVEALAGLLEDTFSGTTFEPTGPLNRAVKSKAIVNVATNEVRDFAVWNDACDERNRYLVLRLRSQSGEGSAYSVAGVHIPWDSETECRRQNATLIRSTVETWDDPSIAAGDFNQRAVVEQRECDLDETSEPLPWWVEMTTSDEGQGGFDDAVRVEAQRAGDPVGEQWTYEGIGPTKLCDGTTKFRRNRIDYIFVRGMPVLDAGADDPGWAGEEPGTFNCVDETDCRYSDHRFVWARLGLDG